MIIYLVIFILYFLVQNGLLNLTWKYNKKNKSGIEIG